MNYLDLPKPHGWLLWRGKQKSIASDTPLSADSLLIISDGEAYGQAVLSQPSAVNIPEFERLEDEHCIRREERKLYWPDTDKLYIHRLKEWQPFESMKQVKLDNGRAEVIEASPLTHEQAELIRQAERLPKTLVLLDEAVTLCDGKAVYCNGVDSSKLEPILNATLEGVKSADDLPVYQLALVRIPRLSFKEKKSEVKAMPYKVVNNHPDCGSDKPYAVVNTDTDELKGCSATEEAAKKHLAALMANEGKSLKELIAEARKCYDGGMPMPVMYGGPTTFKDLQALEDAQEQAQEAQELTWQFQVLSSNILASPDIQDEAAALSALATEYGGLVSEAVKSSEVGEDTKAEQGGYLVTGEEGNHLPTRKNGKLDHRLMGAAWAALHGGYRGNKYQGPGKQQAIAKLKKLYEQEGMDTPSEKGDTEVPEGEKVGKRLQGKMKDKLKAAWETLKELMDWAEPMPDETMAMFSKAIGIKEVNGKPWFFAYSTNAFEDREQEIFSTKSLEKYVEEAEKKSDRGFFNFWHIPGSDFAKKEWQAVPGKFLVEAGPFLDNELGQVALKFFSTYPDGHPEIAPEGWGCSPEYRYLPEERKSGIYENIWITRTSALPRMAAANIWTKGTIMAVTESQEKAGRTLFGEDLYAKLIKPAETQTKELEGAGVASKEVTTETTTAVDFSLEDVVEAVAKRVTPDMQPFADALTAVAQQIIELQGQVKSLEKSKALSEDTELPRFVFQMKRASEAQETKVADDDALKNKKPLETERVDKSGAAAFFPAR